MERAFRAGRLLCYAFCVAILITYLFPTLGLSGDRVPNEVMVIFKPGVRSYQLGPEKAFALGE